MYDITARQLRKIKLPQDVGIVFIIVEYTYSICMYILLYKTLKCTRTCCVINVRIITNKDRLRSILRNILYYIHKPLWFMNASKRVIGFTNYFTCKVCFLRVGE